MTQEDSLQITVMDWMRIKYPDVLCVHIPNGGSRNKIEAAKLKRMGVTPGMPDIFIPAHRLSKYIVSPDQIKGFEEMWKNPLHSGPFLINAVDDFNPITIRKPYHGFFCELKIKPNKIKKESEQEKIIERLKGLGYYVCVCFSLDEFIKEWEGYVKS